MLARTPIEAIGQHGIRRRRILSQFQLMEICSSWKFWPAPSPDMWVLRVCAGSFAAISAAATRPERQGVSQKSLDFLFFPRLGF
jgi:hypothetical protein